MTPIPAAALERAARAACRGSRAVPANVLGRARDHRTTFARRKVICALRRGGYSERAIAAALGISPSYVHRVLAARQVASP